MRKFSGVVRALICAVLVAACVIPGGAAGQTQTKTKSLNIMLVVDDTVSMQLNDPNHIASLALQKFTDTIPSEGSYIAMATYDDDILTKVPENQAMLHIRGSEDKKILKEYAETGLTQDGRYTDLPRALYYALEQIRAVQDSENRPAIIAVSDGENDYMNAAARSRSEEYLELVRQAGVPVYLMVINASNESGVREYMESIAADTGGEAYFIQSGDEIDVRLNALVEELYDLTDDTGQTLDITMTPEKPEAWPFTLEDGIFEASLELNHTAQLGMELIGPDGAQIPLSGNDSVIVSELPDKDTLQTTIRLIEPEPGQYQLQMSSAEQQPVLGRIILNKEIYIQVDVSPNPAEPDQPIHVSAKLMRGSEQYTDLEFVNLTASITVDGGAPVVMDKDVDRDCFRTDLNLTADGTYQLVVSVQSQKNFFRSSDPLELTVASPAQPPAQQSPTQTPNRQTPSDPPEPTEPDGPPVWLIIAAVAALVAIILVVVLLVLRRKPKSKYIRLQGTLTVTYLDDMHQHIWESYVQPGRYYSPRSPAPLGRMLHDQPNSGGIPPFFDQLYVAGVQYGPGQINVEITGEFPGGGKVSSRIPVSTGTMTDEFDYFEGPATTLIVFPDGTQTELSFTVG